jgi:hypothetical protein
VKGVTNQSRPSDAHGKIQVPSLPLYHKAAKMQKLQNGQGKLGTTFKPSFHKRGLWCEKEFANLDDLIF